MFWLGARHPNLPFSFLSGSGTSLHRIMSFDAASISHLNTLNVTDDRETDHAAETRVGIGGIVCAELKTVVREQQR